MPHLHLGSGTGSLSLGVLNRDNLEYRSGRTVFVGKHQDLLFSILQAGKVRAPFPAFYYW